MCWGLPARQEYLGEQAEPHYKLVPMHLDPRLLEMQHSHA